MAEKVREAGCEETHCLLGFMVTCPTKGHTCGFLVGCLGEEGQHPFWRGSSMWPSNSCWHQPLLLKRRNERFSLNLSLTKFKSQLEFFTTSFIKVLLKHVSLQILLVSFQVEIVHIFKIYWSTVDSQYCVGFRYIKTRGFNPRAGKIPWRRKWQPIPVFWPGDSHGQRSLVGYGPWGHEESDMTDWACTHIM